MERLIVIYREWTENDFNDVRRVLLETWLDAYGSFIPAEDIRGYFTATYSVEKLLSLYTSPTSKGYVAVDNEGIAGFERLQYDEKENRLYVSSVYVLPGHQGKGIGRQLLHLAEDEARRLRLDRIWLGVMSQNTPSVAWYRKLGFTFIQEEPFQMGGTSVQHLIGYKLLA
jgi:ribosomal protein S18 acetylase RimI-like enzyme